MDIHQLWLHVHIEAAVGVQQVVFQWLFVVTFEHCIHKVSFGSHHGANHNQDVIGQKDPVDDGIQLQFIAQVRVQRVS